MAMRKSRPKTIRRRHRALIRRVFFLSLFVVAFFSLCVPIGQPDSQHVLDVPDTDDFDSYEQFVESGVGSSWYSASWSYRVPCFIMRAPNAGTNYQIVVQVERSSATTESNNRERVHVGTLCQDDFGDIRFTDDDGTTLLDYYYSHYTI